VPTYTLELVPRFYETDAQGHISNVSIAGWFETARISFLEWLLPADMSARGWILASIKIDYVGETFLGAPVTATVTSATVGRSSVTIECEMTQHGKPTVIGVAVLVHMDRETRRPTPLPDELRAPIEAYQADDRA
jgi:acyl-CoA thioester hydrolase